MFLWVFFNVGDAVYNGAKKFPIYIFFRGHSTMSWYISIEVYWLLCVSDALCSRAN
jgi:hypothetical protein